MSEKEPQLQDFGITPEEFDLYAKREPAGWDWIIGVVIVSQFCILFSVVFFVTSDLGISFVWGFFGAIFPPGIFVSGPLGMLVKSAFVGYKRSRLLKSPVARKIELYEKAETDFYENQRRARREAINAERETRRVEWARREAELERKRKLRDYWMNLSGGQFERELAALFTRRGYRVELRGGAGDGGIDILARKGGKTTIIQCKRYKNPVGPAAARELYGSLIASGADQGILACTSGFTKGVRDFVKGKPVQLVDSWDIIKVAEATEGHRDEQPSSDISQRARRRRRRWTIAME